MSMNAMDTRNKYDGSLYQITEGMTVVNDNNHINIEVNELQKCFLS